VFFSGADYLPVNDKGYERLIVLCHLGRRRLSGDLSRAVVAVAAPVCGHSISDQTTGANYFVSQFIQLIRVKKKSHYTSCLATDGCHSLP